MNLNTKARDFSSPAYREMILLDLRYIQFLAIILWEDFDQKFNPLVPASLADRLVYLAKRIKMRLCK